MEKQKAKNTARWNTVQFVTIWILNQISAIIIAVVLSLVTVFGAFAIDPTLGAIASNLAPLIGIVLMVYLSALIQRWAILRYSGLTIRGWAWQTAIATIIGIVWGIFIWWIFPYANNLTESFMRLLIQIVPIVLIISGIQYRILSRHVGRDAFAYVGYNTIGAILIIGSIPFLLLGTTPFLIVHLLVQGILIMRTLDAVHEDNLAIDLSK
ncbi:MAG: hypothetical protein AAF846_23675 [Chloroflexota bacterium]